MRARPSKAQSANLALMVASVILGFLLTVQFRSTAARLPEREQSRLATADAVRRLEDEQRQLKQRITELRSEIASVQRATGASDPARLVTADVDQQKLLAGLVALHGPGISVTLDDSTKTVGPSDDANNYIIHDYEIRDIVSLLWMAGAEAIAINGERLVNVSSVYCVGSTILVNDTRLSPPYEIVAIGEPAALDGVISNPKNLSKLRARVKTYGIQLKVSVQKDVTVPAYSGTLNIRYARPTMTPARNEGQKMRGM